MKKSQPHTPNGPDHKWQAGPPFPELLREQDRSDLGKKPVPSQKADLAYSPPEDKGEGEVENRRRKAKFGKKKGRGAKGRIDTGKVP